MLNIIKYIQQEVLESLLFPPNSHIHTHLERFALLLVLFMYSRVRSITVYSVCTQPADLMSPVFIYLQLLGKEGAWLQPHHVPVQRSRVLGNAEKSAVWSFQLLETFERGEKKQNKSNSVSQLL